MHVVAEHRLLVHTSAPPDYTVPVLQGPCSTRAQSPSIAPSTTISRVTPKSRYPEIALGPGCARVWLRPWTTRGRRSS
ncbi:hypothetical protein C8Q76DRAFT_184765 [Earliella scabrosa]|nr:hypothetical protein C8Q76DRAFT_184765 [Earliella scabrosa]